MTSEVATVPGQKQSALFEAHLALGAEMVEKDGYSVPMNYGDVGEEYAAVRSRGAGLIDLSSRAQINVSGTEAVQFLNGLITNDVKTLDEGMWMLAAFPNVQGRLLANVRVLRRADGYLFDTELATHDVVFKTLDRFTLAGDFRVADLTADLATISVQGSYAIEIAETVLGGELTSVEHWRTAERKWNDNSVTVIRTSHTSEDGFDIFISASDVESLWNELTRAGAEPVGFEALEILRIESGFPSFGVDIDSTNVVLESGVDDAVSFTKGCYIGQEIIARIHWRGHVAKKIAGVILDEQGTVQADDKLHSIDGKEIGRITSTCYSPKLERQIALCLIKYDYLTPDIPVIVISNNGQHAGRVSKLPFVTGSWKDLKPTSPALDK